MEKIDNQKKLNSNEKVETEFEVNSEHISSDDIHIQEKTRFRNDATMKNVEGILYTQKSLVQVLNST
jgi:hypothetical protein